MKKITNFGIGIFLAMFLSAGIQAQQLSDVALMHIVAETEGGSFYIKSFDSDRPLGEQGFSAEKIEGKAPIFGEKFIEKLRNLEIKSAQDWGIYKQAVGELPEDKKYSNEELLEMARADIGTNYLVKITNSYKIYYRGKLIGYAFEADDFVEAMRIEDGAGMVFYLNAEQDWLMVHEWQA